MTRRRWISLRWRAVAAFALTALVLSSTLAMVAFFLVRASLVDGRESAALNQAYTNARLIRNRLREADPDVTATLSSLQVGPEGDALLEWDGDWFSSSVSVDETVLPESLHDEVRAGNAASQRQSTLDGVRMAVGVPITESAASYFEVTTLDEVESTLDSLRSRLVLATALATLTGAAVGASITSTVFRPLRRTAVVANEISQGDLDHRLPLNGDQDLDPLAASFNTMVDELEDRIRRESRFASDASHELRGPLTALSAAVSIVRRRHDQLPPEVAASVVALEQNVESFNQLVLDLLEISRFEAGTAQLAVRSIDAREFVQAVLDERQEAAPIVDDLDGPVRVEADPRRMQQVISNLLDNATNHGGGATGVVLAQPHPGIIRICVDDAGPGVPAADRDKVFQRFERGTAGQAPDAPYGTGLGLALVQDHVALHGGRVWIEDAPAGGARFVVELPVVQP